ncbi:MAG TPA: methylenetetrahydrofolate reductase [NAD(P)H] [Saprospiraceae bacterium]|nr:methylenetetrahydrofolate reductase [NAD(P)H] [Saprospiraceae bacterium]HRO08698.1 methylenetetrahydrofolate reductase [NAD(P)H] [Saprospiraceae bacterium]HRP42009.1 methylenetetrahydrofolate reductase [NAD(P)H] [Saprospiraceae bacterium]
MRVTQHYLNAIQNNSFNFSIEILPPVKGQNIQHIFNTLDPLMEMKPAFIDVTYHREEYVYKKHDNGLLERKTVQKRPGTVAICAAIQNHYKVDAVPHIICGGFNREDTENALIELNFLGIDNLLVLRGDPIKSESTFIAEENGHKFASELLEQIVNLNHGNYLDDELLNSSQTDFCIGVAGYPEKHFESPNLNIDLQYLKKKIDLGADYIVTQMFFDNQKFFDFVFKCRNSGIQVPIIPGIKPITTLSQITSLPKTFHVDLPDILALELIKAKDNAAVRQIGHEWAVQQCRELLKNGIPLLHFYTMSKSEVVNNIIKELL